MLGKEHQQYDPKEIKGYAARMHSVSNEGKNAFWMIGKAPYIVAPEYVPSADLERGVSYPFSLCENITVKIIGFTTIIDRDGATTDMVVIEWSSTYD